MCAAGSGISIMSVSRDRQRVDRHLPMRRVEFHILLSLVAGARHGYGILQDIGERDEIAVPDIGTMYRALARMVENELIQPTVRQSAPDATDERRNYYQITELGVRVAKAEARGLEALTRAARTGGLLGRKARWEPTA
jgi:DNA-binding PadR family transcriptional regulator